MQCAIFIRVLLSCVPVPLFDSVVRHQLASEGPFDVTDKFRIDIYIDKQLVGRKQVLSTLVRRRLTAEVHYQHLVCLHSIPSCKRLELCTSALAHPFCLAQ